MFLLNSTRVFHKGYDSHLSTAFWTKEWIYIIDFPDQLGPASGRDKWSFLDNNRRMGRIFSLFIGPTLSLQKINAGNTSGIFEVWLL
jgi:hypothetical protein